MMQYTISELSQLDRVAADLAKSLEKATFVVLLLSGTLGSGKTTFTSHLGHHLGISHAMQSPTYTIIREYPLQGTKLTHVDLYRLSSLEEAFEYGVFELFDEDKGIVVIEWPELIDDHLPELPEVYHLKFDLHDELRLLTVTKR